MGEAPAFFGDELQKGYPNGFDLKSKGSETSVVVGNRTYVIGGACEESALSIGVRIFDQTSGEWINPTVLGTKPKSCKGHSAVLLSGDRILIIKSGSNSDDFAWFLEVDTQYVRQQKKMLGTEVVAWSKGVRGSAEKPVVISGPSGVGKGTLISMLMKAYPSMFGFSVSHTTRAPRAMEKDGVHYHFIERSAMEKEIEDGKFLEFSSATGNPNPLSSASNLHYVHSIIHMNNTTSTVSGIHERVTELSTSGIFSSSVSITFASFPDELFHKRRSQDSPSLPSNYPPMKSYGSVVHNSSITPYGIAHSSRPFVLYIPDSQPYQPISYQSESIYTTRPTVYPQSPQSPQSPQYPQPIPFTYHIRYSGPSNYQLIVRRVTHLLLKRSRQNTIQIWEMVLLQWSLILSQFQTITWMNHWPLYLEA